MTCVFSVFFVIISSSLFVGWLVGVCTLCVCACVFVHYYCIIIAIDLLCSITFVMVFVQTCTHIAL
jgi:hypothetical protein